jgi:hypothetical protein
MFKASDYRDTGLRVRQHTPWGAKPYTDYVCGKHTMIVPDPAKGCSMCGESEAKTEADRVRAQAFFAEQKAKRKQEREESERLTREAVAARKARK